MKKIFLIGITFISLNVLSQIPATSSKGEVTVLKPTIMVIPWVDNDQDIRSVLESDFNKRYAVSIMSKSFDDRGYTTKDFLEVLKICETSQMFNSNTQKSFKEVILEQSGADMVVSIDMQTIPGDGNQVRVILTLLDKRTGAKLGSEQSDSKRLYTQDIGMLTKMAIDNAKDSFMSLIQTKFTEIVNNGIAIKVEFRISANSTISFDDETGGQGDLLSEVLMDWLKKNSFKSYAKKGEGSTSKFINYEDVRIPLKDQVTGNNYDIQEFGRSLRKYIYSLGLKPIVEYGRGVIILTF
jgi:hypothetical protein